MNQKNTPHHSIAEKASLLSREKARGIILDAIPDMIFTISKDGFFRSFEGATDELYHEKSYYVGRTIYDVMPRDTADLIMQYIRRAFKSGRLQYYEYRLPINNEVRHYEARMLKSSDDEVVSIVRNITKIKETEAELQRYHNDLEEFVEARTEDLAKAEERYRKMFEHSGAPSIIVENDFIISMANPRFEQLSGFSKEEIEGRITLLDFIVPEDAERVKKYHYARRSEGGSAPNEYECRIKDRQGGIRDIFIKVGMMPGPGRAIASLIDISSLKKTETALREREALYSAVLEGFEGLIYIVSKDFRFQFVNDQLSRFIGRNAVGETCYKALHNRKSVCPWCVGKQVFGGERIRFEMINPKDEKWYSSVNTPIYHADGTVSYQAMIVDIDKRKRMEETLKESEAFLRKENSRLRSTIKERYKFGNIIGKSDAMQEVYELILNAAGSSANIIVYGESGTGKELVSKAIHDMSDRKDGPYVPVNCGAIPENLLESEFFGHTKGAFTGANTDKQGYLDEADGGTLFLDEIGEIPLTLQVKLLRAVEGSGFVPVGGHELRKPDFRVISATNRNLADHVRKGLMREDFFYRIHIIPIQLPALRNRKEDIPLLVEHMMEPYGESARSTLNAKVMDALVSHDWPGNVRELQNVIHRFVTLKRLDFLGQHQLIPAEAAKPQPVASDLRNAVKEFEKKFIQKALEANRWNRTKAAKDLKIGLRTLQRKMKMLDIL